MIHGYVTVSRVMPRPQPRVALRWAGKAFHFSGWNTRNAMKHIDYQYVNFLLYYFSDFTDFPDFLPTLSSQTIFSVC